MAEKMLVTQALDERDLLVDKITDKIGKAVFIDTIKPNEDKVFEERISREDFAKNAESAYQQIQDLIDRYQKIDSAIVASNAKTKVKTSYGEYTVAGAISLRNRLRSTGSYDGSTNFEYMLQKKMETDLQKMIQFADTKNKQLQSTAESMRLSYSFSPTSLGMAITVSCSCGQKLFLGNFMDHDEKEVDMSKYGPLSQTDIENKKFEEDAFRILQMESPRICMIASARKQTFEMIYFFAVGVACNADPRISKSILYSYSLDKYHHQTNNYTGSERENIELFFRHFKQKIRDEIEKYDCDNEALLEKLYS